MTENVAPCTCHPYADSIDRRGCTIWQGMYRGYIAGATAENERMAELLKRQHKIIEILLDELIYESGSQPGTFFMWGRNGGSAVSEKIIKIKLEFEALKS